ncbi:1,2-phenylacetyl-CoA epoxidase subunit PaaC [Corynebacterium halotolerans]|uniref:Phenylacetate-CoA oxygenase subunit PaaI n=1 Tax=Corynebacterium halotolerans YIM 70093 = DSM 44683 TaxID=1121362 RepID=M1P1N5_9CORY|nr:1,2-phenylacetyl-CoA epoxidase subunit PaaC [Corynebacterium halotolerans]AGF73725.1 phenylacetate-CoA oxygenase subunit PaaI [Corynebacterium halotolerans YIM 70093 = DSM 44683]
MSSFATADSATRHTQGDAITAEDIQASGATATEDAATYALMLADDALILAQRLGWWVSRAPEMEEDIALGNIALDLVGHARFLYSYAGTAWGRSEDDLAYFRDEEEFRSARLVEQENGDFGHTIARQLLFAHYQLGLYTALCESTDPTLAAIAAKAVKEVEYHVDHANQWVLRLGLGTEESHRRMTAGLENMWPYLAELFEDLPVHERLAAAGAGVLPSRLRAGFDERIAHVLQQSGLEVPAVPQARSGQRTGCFSEYRGFILAEMQSLARRHPGVTW